MLIPQGLGCEPKSKSERLFHNVSHTVRWVGIIAEHIWSAHAAVPLTFVLRPSCVESQHPVISAFPTPWLSVSTAGASSSLSTHNVGLHLVETLCSFKAGMLHDWQCTFSHPGWWNTFQSPHTVYFAVQIRLPLSLYFLSASLAHPSLPSSVFFPSVVYFLLTFLSAGHLAIDLQEHLESRF